MGIVSKFQNLNRVVKNLRKRKFTRAREIVRDYGLREFLRRVGEKMKYGDSNVHLYERIFVITNESFLGSKASLKPFQCEQNVSFSTAPAADNVGRVDILTCNESGNPDASLTLEIFNKGKLLATRTVSGVAHNGYTTFVFMPILEVIYHPLDFVITSDTEGCGVLVNRSRKKHGFIVQGGGSVACKVYTQLDALYVHWLENNVPTLDELQKQRERQFAVTPKISVIVPLYNTPEQYFREVIESVIAQTYPNWELCLADGSTDSEDRKTIINSYNDQRIKYKKLERNEGISGNSNHAIEMATGDYISLLDHDDVITPHALFANVELINQDPDYEFIYSDEDKISMDSSRRFDPFFKPDFSPNMLFSFNYITHFVTIKKSLLDEIGLFRDEYNGAQDYDLVLRATERAKKVGHIKDVLYSWRIAETSTALSSSSKEYTILAGKAALEETIRRRGLHAHVEEGVLPNYYNMVYDIPNPQPKISIIIPSHDEVETLKKCVSSILKKSTYQNYEILIVENNSKKQSTFAYYDSIQKDPRIRVIEWNHQPFNFASINNFAASETESPLLLFLNNDVTILSPDWLEQMAMHALREEIGAVGAKLYYPDDTLQHGGVIFLLGSAAGHSHKGSGRHEVGALARLTLVHDLSAVTAACLMTRKEVFDQIGGFDEQYVLAFNDVDLCLKIRDAGYSIVWTPYAELYHYESKTRGYEDTPEKEHRFLGELFRLYDKWYEKYEVDPFYNPNLTHFKEDYSIDPGKTGASLRETKQQRKKALEDYSATIDKEAGSGL